MSFAPENATRERTLGPWRVRLAGIQALNVLNLRYAGIVLCQCQSWQEKEQQAGLDHVGYLFVHHSLLKKPLTLAHSR